MKEHKKRLLKKRHQQIIDTKGAGEEDNHEDCHASNDNISCDSPIRQISLEGDPAAHQYREKLANKLKQDLLTQLGQANDEDENKSDISQSDSTQKSLSHSNFNDSEERWDAIEKRQKQKELENK